MRLYYKLVQSLLKNKLDAPVGVSGPDKKDSRDFHIGWFGFGNQYEPKHKRHIIKTLSTKDQRGRNTCTFESSVCGKEVDEGIALSVRSVVAWAKQRGYIKGDGFSSLKNSQLALQKFGAARADLVDDSFRSWQYYSSPRVLTEAVKRSAEEHKTKSFWKVDTLSEVYELLDNNRTVQIAEYWYTGYNQNSGFRFPWIQSYRKGYRVGAHAEQVVGYDRDYHGHDVIIKQNSFGENWADNGLFYIKIEDFIKELRIFRGMTNLDVPKDVGKFIRDYTGEDVKVEGTAPVYRIECGKKRHYVDIEAFHRENSGNGIYFVGEDLLNMVPVGEPIT